MDLNDLFETFLLNMQVLIPKNDAQSMYWNENCNQELLIQEIERSDAPQEAQNIDVLH